MISMQLRLVASKRPTAEGDEKPVWIDIAIAMA